MSETNIPSEIKAEAEKRYPSLPYLVNHPSYTKEEYASLHGTITEGINQRRSDFISGYQLATDGREELEKDCETWQDSAITWEAKFNGLQSSLKEKEKECEELMQELKAKYFYTEALRREIEELKAENERLQVAFDNNYKEFMLLGTHAKDLEAENKKLRDWVNATNPWKEDDK